MIIHFFEPSFRTDLLPLAFTRPVADFRVGILTIRQKWEKRLNASSYTLTEPYLSELYPMKESEIGLCINGAVCPTEILCDEVMSLRLGQALVKNDLVLAYRAAETQPSISIFERIESRAEFSLVRNLWDIFSLNGKELDADFALLTIGRSSLPISSTNNVIAPEHIFLEEGAKVECSILNASTGKIYLGKNAEIMEGSVVRGALALCEDAGLKLSTKVYGPSTLGPHCKVGGEINNVVLFGYSNKGHDGFLGNAVVGEWVNIGADTNNSNLKNNYGQVKLWNYTQQKFTDTGLQFCGLIMADHAKCGINTMFNTGTVVGVASNVFGAGFPRNFIADFSWGGAGGFTEHSLAKALETARAMMQRRKKELTLAEEKVLESVFKQTATFRT